MDHLNLGSCFGVLAQIQEIERVSAGEEGGRASSCNVAMGPSQHLASGVTSLFLLEEMRPRYTFDTMPG
jgi:hypothetical protein